MSFPVAVILAYVISFALGSIPMGVVIGKLFFGVDPRSGGSGSIGATNSNRMLGAKGGAAVLILDMLKGAVAVGIAKALVCYGGFTGQGADLIVAGSVFFAISGHIFSPWLGFKGGKGISTGMGTLTMACWPIGVGILAVFIVFVAATRIVSVGSIAAAASVVVWAILFNWGSIPFAVFGLITSALVIWAHRANIGRLMRHEEPKFSLGKSPKREEDNE